MSIIAPIIEMLGYSTDVIYRCICPGKTKWARASYYASGLILLIAALFGLKTQIASNTQHSETIALIAIVLFAVILTIIHPLLSKYKL
jgi:membrane protein YdbS with pleckstrin-like domain